jgi:hypothetical protein
MKLSNQIMLLSIACSVLLAGCKLDDIIFGDGDNPLGADARGAQGFWVTGGNFGAASSSAVGPLGNVGGPANAALIIAADGESAQIGLDGDCTGECLLIQQNGELVAGEFGPIVNNCPEEPIPVAATIFAPGCAYQDADVTGTTRAYKVNSYSDDPVQLSVSGVVTQWYHGFAEGELELVGKSMALTYSGCLVNGDPVPPAECPTEPEPGSATAQIDGPILDIIDDTLEYEYIQELYEYIPSSNELLEDDWNFRESLASHGYDYGSLVPWQYNGITVDANGDFTGIAEFAAPIPTSAILTCSMAGNIVPVNPLYNVYRVAGTATCSDEYTGDVVSVSNQTFDFSGLSVLLPFDLVSSVIGDFYRTDVGELPLPPLDCMLWSIDGLYSYDSVVDGQTREAGSFEMAVTQTLCRRFLFCGEDR